MGLCGYSHGRGVGQLGDDICINVCTEILLIGGFCEWLKMVFFHVCLKPFPGAEVKTLLDNGATESFFKATIILLLLRTCNFWLL